MSWQQVVANYKEHNDYLIEEVKEKNAEILKLREALEFYADSKNYVFYRFKDFGPISEDCGEKARQALKE